MAESSGSECLKLVTIGDDQVVKTAS